MSDAYAATSRPRVHDRSTAVEQTTFAATERLLRTVSARDLSVAQIIREAGVSRATFYHYFSSKWDVITDLVTGVMDDIYRYIELIVVADEKVSRHEALRQSIEQGCAIWAQHRAVLTAIVEHWREVPQLREMWLSALHRIRDAVAAQLDRDRAAGLAPAGPDSQELVTALLWATANCLYAAGLEDLDELPEAGVSELVTALWMRTLYEGQGG